MPWRLSIDNYRNTSQLPRACNPTKNQTVDSAKSLLGCSTQKNTCLIELGNSRNEKESNRFIVSFRRA